MTDEVTGPEAIKFLEEATRNWRKPPRSFTRSDIDDVAVALTLFVRTRTATHPAAIGDDVVERVARALCTEGSGDVDVFIGINGRKVFEDNYLDAARAAIAAMRGEGG